MPKLAKIHQGKQSFRRHFLNEWLEERHMEPMEFLDALNETTGMELPIIDKSQVYRWLKGQLPQKRAQTRIAGVLNLLDHETGEPMPELLMTHPAQVWIAEKLKDRSPDDIERVKKAVELVLPDRTGTDG